jgi:hypothetical protein
MVLIVRSRMPNAKIIGPEYAAYDQNRLQTFLSFAKANNVLPDVLAWHEIIQPSGCGVGPAVVACSGTDVDYIGQYSFDSRVATIRNYMTSTLGLAQPIPIEVDESLTPNTHLRPGGFVASAVTAQRNGLRNIGIACWTENISGADNCSVSSLNGAITPDLAHKRSRWWAVKSYADLAGRYRQVTGADGFDGLASWDSASQTIRMTLANIGGQSSTNLVLSNMASATANQHAAVTVQRIQDQGETTVDTLPAPTTLNLTVSGGILTIPITGSAQWDAYAITITMTP